MKKNRKGEEIVCVSVYVPVQLRDDLTKYAAEDGYSTTSDFVRKVLREHADKRKAQATEGTGHD